MPSFITDELAIAARLTTLQFGALRRLRLHGWAEKVPCTLPDDDARLAGLSGLGDAWAENADAIREYLTPTEVDASGRPRVIDAELRKVYEKQLAKYVTASTNGKRGGRPKAGGKEGGKQMEKLGETPAFVGLRNHLSSVSSSLENTDDPKAERKPDFPTALRPGEGAMIEQERAWSEANPGKKLPLDFHSERRAGDRRQSVTTS